jgi:hypothetical protein
MPDIDSLVFLSGFSSYLSSLRFIYCITRFLSFSLSLSFFLSFYNYIYLISIPLVSKMSASAPKRAPCVSQGCREFLETDLLLRNESQITPVTNSTVLKVAALTTLYSLRNRKNLHIIGGEKKGMKESAQCSYESRLQ